MAQKLLTISGVEMPPPDYSGGYSVTVSDLDSDSSTRSETGMLTRNRIRGGLYKLQLRWQSLTKEQMIQIMDTIEPDNFMVDFFFAGKIITAKMYSGDKNTTLTSFKNESSRWSVDCSLIEY